MADTIPQGVEEPLRSKLVTAINQSREILARLRQVDQRIISKAVTLQLLETIEADFRPLFEAGGVSRIQFYQQRNAVQEQRTELAALREERSLIFGAVSGRINANNRDLANLESELVRLKEDLSYRIIKAPIDGKVFDLRVSPSSLVATDQVVLKLVPEGRLVANVNITNRDIGFVKVGLPVTVGVDSFLLRIRLYQGILGEYWFRALPPDQAIHIIVFRQHLPLISKLLKLVGKNLISKVACRYQRIFVYALAQ